MEITIAEQKAFVINEQLNAQAARERAIEKKIDAFGTVAKFLQRPKPEEIQIVYSEKRYEPFWHIVAKARYVFERKQKYRVPINDLTVKTVTINQQVYTPQTEKAAIALQIEGLEHCEDIAEKQLFLDGISGERKDYAAYLKYPTTAIPQLSEFSPSDALILPPQVRIAHSVRELLNSMLKAVQADHILEERAEVSEVGLYFRPIYAFECHWTTKDKRQVIEFDGLSGAVKSDGKTVRQTIRKLVDSDLLFDVSGEALNLVLPGGSIAVKLARAAAQKSFKE